MAQVTTLHPPRDPRIFAKIARSLAAAGFRVVLIHPGAESEIEDGVTLQGLALRGGRITRMIVGGWRAFIAGLRSGATILQFHDPELLPFAFMWRMAGRRVIYDVHEDLPRDITIKPWIPGPLRPLVALVATGVEWIAGHVLSGVSAATETIGARFPASRTVIVRNYPEDLDRFRGSSLPWAERPPLIIYPGLLTAERGVRTMIEAVRRLPPQLGATLTLAGQARGQAAEDIATSARGDDRIRYLGVIPRAEVLRMYARARVGLHLPAGLPHFHESLPIKLFEYMAAGLPVVISDFPAWREIVERHHCGLVADPADIGAVSAAIEQLLSDPFKAERMGRNGQEAVFAHYSWQGEAKRLLDLYRRLIPEMA